MTPLQELASLPHGRRDAIIEALPAGTAAELLTRWDEYAHRGQHWSDAAWRIWLIRAGRGFGKTRAGSEWVNHVARTVPGARIALVGATADEASRPRRWRRCGGPIGGCG
ncbi:hypothetical protein [Sphingomonas sp. NBWT7]|uniref:hypothetical protein n=1 Tax=Sphingomonas sp. NBWT7 TaxID=2596913 RepID=UPI0035BC1092